LQDLQYKSSTKVPGSNKNYVSNHNLESYQTDGDTSLELQDSAQKKMKQFNSLEKGIIKKKSA